MELKLARLLAQVHGEVREMRGEMTEFKRQTLVRLEHMEKRQRKAALSVLSAAAVCITSAAGLVTFASYFR